MKHFSRALADYLASAKISQTEFSRESGIITSKLSRLLSNTVLCDRDTLDQALSAVKSNEARRDIVAGYIKDVTSPAALMFLEAKKETEPWADLEIERLSRKGQAAFNALMKSDYLENVETILVDLAEAFRLPLK
jgi:hypothetical protein